MESNKIDSHSQINLMPLIKIHSLGKERAWGLWYVQEAETELSSLCGEHCPSEIINEQKRLEWLAGRGLIKSLMENLGLEYHGLNKDEFGKPF